MQIRLLGDVRAVSEDGETVDIGPPKCQAVLAALALSAGSSVPVPRLLELVWGTEQPRTADKTLQSYVTRLRKGLGHETIIRSGSSYRLALEPDSVDALRFQAALDDGDIDRALAEWTGPPLAGLDAEGLKAAASRLVEGWLGAREESLAAELEHEPASAVATLTELTVEHPFREELWALLMIGLYRLGRQAEALAAFRRARDHLVTELGAEPGPRLRELEIAVLNHDPALSTHWTPERDTTNRSDPARDRSERQSPATADRRAAPAPAPATPAPGQTLPVPSTQLFGRDDDIDMVVGLLEKRRLVTIRGLGGAGKTRLALAAANEALHAETYPDGVFFASLIPIESGDQIGRVIGEALGLTVGSTDLASLATFIGARRLLLVIDNCEHVVDDVAMLVSEVLVAGVHGRVLLTSREALDVDDEYVHGIKPLATGSTDSPGFELLVDRGTKLRPDLETDGAAAEALIDICTRLDGIPLALELAAAQLAHLTPVELAERLDGRFELLVRTRPGRVTHHQTLQAAMDWSWELLTPHEQSMAEQLSVFAGGWTLDAAEGVCEVAADSSAVLDLRSLVAKSLVVSETAPAGSGHGRTRYKMLETVRFYARDRLHATGDAPGAEDRHARFFCESADDVPFVDRFMQPDIAVRWSAEIDNIAAAIEWLRSRDRLVEAALLLTMPASTWRFQPAPQSLRKAMKELLNGSLPPRVRCQLVIGSLDAATGRSAMSAKGHRARDVVDLASDIGDAALVSVALLMEGSPLGAVDPDRAQQLLDECVAWGERAGDNRLVAMGLGMLGGVEAFGRGRYDEARSALEQASAVASEDGFDRHTLFAQQLSLEVMAGDWAAGRDAYRQLRAFHETAGLAVNWHDAIDDAVFADQLGETRDRPLATAIDRLESAGGDPVDWPDLLVIPLGQACSTEDWDRAARIIQAIRHSSRSGLPLSAPNATAFYIDFRRRVPPPAIERSAAKSITSVLAEEVSAERS
ncbi:MAG: AfsR/SARP family transcriptional regulator [Acidimicrobiales bacterium]